MSCVRCMGCDDIIDTDYDVECFRDESGHMIYCDPCWDDRVCKSCGEQYADCDDDCHDCYASLFITGAEVYDPNETAPGGKRLWSLPGFSKAEKIILAARAARNAA